MNDNLTSEQQAKTAAFIAKTLKNVDENGPMAGVNTMLVLELSNLIHHSAAGTPKDRLADYIIAIATYYTNLTTLVSAKITTEELMKHPRQEAGSIALFCLHLTLTEGEALEISNNTRLTLLREALNTDFPPSGAK